MTQSVLRFATIAPLLSLCLINAVPASAATPGIPGKFYEYHLIATTGQSPTNASSPLTGTGDNPSINANGTVAFVGQFSNGEGVVVGDASGRTSPLITTGFVSPTRHFGRAVQINGNGLVMANDYVAGSPPLYFERLWNVMIPGSYREIARGGPTYPYDAVFNQGSVNDLGDTVFGLHAPWPRKRSRRTAYPAPHQTTVNGAARKSRASAMKVCSRRQACAGPWWCRAISAACHGAEPRLILRTTS